MYLENVVVDAQEPQRLGRFWEAVLGGETLTDAPGIYETRVAVEGGPALDLCFQPVPEPPSGSPRLHLDVAGGDQPGEVVERLLGLGARRLGDGLADPEGNPFRVVEPYADRGALAALPLDSADPERDAAFWAWLTGWVRGGESLRHPSGLGPALALVPEAGPKAAAKNRLHLDVRLETGEDADTVAAAIVEHGGSRWDPGWGELPWRSYADPSGNEFCVLPAPG